MQKTISLLVHCVAWLAVVLTLWLTVIWISLIFDMPSHGGAIDGWGGLGFAIFSTYIGGGTLVCGFLPSCILYWYTRQSRDWLSLGLSAASLLMIFAEIVVMSYLPHGGGC